MLISPAVRHERGVEQAPHWPHLPHLPYPSPAPPYSQVESRILQQESWELRAALHAVHAFLTGGRGDSLAAPSASGTLGGSGSGSGSGRFAVLHRWGLHLPDVMRPWLHTLNAAALSRSCTMQALLVELQQLPAPSDAAGVGLSAAQYAMLQRMPPAQLAALRSVLSGDSGCAVTGPEAAQLLVEFSSAVLAEAHQQVGGGFTKLGACAGGGEGARRKHAEPVSGCCVCELQIVFFRSVCTLGPSLQPRRSTLSQRQTAEPASGANGA